MSTHNVKPAWNFYENQGPDTVLPQLKSFVSRRARRERCKFFYIGQTSDPERRLSEHQRKLAAWTDDLWTHMEVIYGHWSLGAVLKVETELIRHARQIGNPKWRGTDEFNRAEGTWNADQVFSVYVMIDEERRGAPDAAPHETFMPANLGAVRARDQRNDLVKAAFDKAVCDTASGKRATYCYVGITDMPERRYREHQSTAEEKYGGGKWTKMHVIYETGRIHHALELESVLFDHAKSKLGPQNVMTSRVRTLDEDGRLPKTYVYLLEERVPRNAPAHP